jgi:deoxyribodipyrimidine photo-lyase
MNADQFGKFQENARFYLDRLSWRRQYMQTFEASPELEFQCMLAQFNGVREADFSLEHSLNHSEKHFTAWKQGLTGFPYIDAAMRFLNQTGWINMRLRATAKKAKDRVSDLRRSDLDRQRTSVEKSSEQKQDFQQSLF